ncbi:uncharacterized protein LOC130284916 [Hyla sarda]|uniref:uncharacterized protein LOC130284916 n=1 Tax=Hyla sarda TaxID=327740 RepID=UPI0024C2C4A0|nr:uncharacterized protein LOC130284916 [Hyla sarda]
MSAGFELGPLTEDEDRMVLEAQFRTLSILEDALKKTRWLLAEPGRDYGLQARNVPLISPELVEDLIQTLQQFEFLKYEKTKYEIGIGALYPASSFPVIGLCSEFWQRHENLSFCSRPGSLIKTGAHILGYHDSDKFWMEGNQRPVLGASRISEAFEVWMRHKGEYVNGSFVCCGEKSIQSVCENSDMRFALHCTLNEEQKDLAETTRKATLTILYDALNKELIVDDSHLIHLQGCAVMLPLIPQTLLAKLIMKLEKVTFKCDSRPRHEAIFAYPGGKAQDVIYLCPLFWLQNERLRNGSRIGTLILCVSQMLGYRHVLDRTSNPEEPTGPQDPHLLTADDICSAFECWMMHREPYTEGSYCCCGENNEISVCRKSIMGTELRQCLREYLA